jgi:hypothetical protein
MLAARSICPERRGLMNRCLALSRGVNGQSVRLLSTPLLEGNVRAPVLSFHRGGPRSVLLQHIPVVAGGPVEVISIWLAVDSPGLHRLTSSVVELSLFVERRRARGGIRIKGKRKENAIVFGVRGVPVRLSVRACR